MKKNKGFTLIELLGVLIIMGLLLLIVVPTIQKYLNRGKESYYSSIEGEMKAAGMEYLESYRSLLPKENGNVVVVSLSELVANKYIDEVKDEKGQPCTGQVAVKRIKNKNYEYYSCLQCGTNGKYYSTGDKIKTATGEEVSVCSVDDSKNVYVDSDEYIVKAPCDTLGNCDVKSCTDVKNCTNPDPPVCTSGTCSIKLDINARTITVEQGIGMLKLPYGKVYYKNNPEPIKTDLMGSPSMVDISKLGRVAVTYSYRGQNEQIYVNVIDKKSPEKPSIALRKNNVFGATYDQTTLPWFSGNIFATFRSTDYAATGILGSGIKEYRVYPGTDGQQVSAPSNTTNFVVLSAPWETMTKEGEYTRYITARDNQGNESGISQYTYRIDKTNPYAPTIEQTNPPTEYGWYSGATVFNIVSHGDRLNTGVNKCSGVKEVSYKLTGDTVQNETVGEQARISNNGTTTIYAYVYDNAGNRSSETVTKEVKVDKDKPTPPTIEIINNPVGQNNWYRGDVTLKITQGTDALSGVERVVFSKTGREVLSERDIANVAKLGTTSGTTTISLEGETTVTAYTIDKAGNRSNPTTIKINIDKTKPNAPASNKLVINKSPTYGSWYTGTVGVSVTANEDITPSGANKVSGKYKIQYRVINGSDTVIASSLSSGTSVTFDIPTRAYNKDVTGASITIYAATVDTAGNISSETSKSIAIDNTAPTCPDAVGGSSTTPTNADRTLSRGCNDIGSGCTTTSGWSYKYSTTTYPTATAPVYGIQDNVGHYTSCNSKVVNVYVDKTAPGAVTISGTGRFENATTVTLSASDAHSGISYYLYSLDGSEPSTRSSGTISLASTGTYRIRAKAVDKAGNVGPSTPVPTLGGLPNPDGLPSVVIEIPIFGDFTVLTGKASHTHKKTDKNGNYNGTTLSEAGSAFSTTDGCWKCKTTCGGGTVRKPTLGGGNESTVMCPSCHFTLTNDDDFNLGTHCKKTCQNNSIHDCKWAIEMNCGKTPVKAKIKISHATNISNHRLRAEIVENGSVSSLACTGGTTEKVNDRELKLLETGKKYTCVVGYTSGTSSTTEYNTTTINFDYQN